MHYIKLHLGDWALGTMHLTPLEEGIYWRLTTKYYAQEQGFPDDLPAICRLIGARSRDEKLSTERVLKEFFSFDGSLWISKRAEKELTAYKEKSSKAAASAKERWSKSQCDDDSNAMRTHTEGNANHKPITNNQEPRESIEVISTSGAESDPPAKPSAAGDTCKALKRHGITSVNPHHPDLVALLGAGVSSAEIVAVAQEPKAKGKPMAWVLAAVRNRRKDAAASEPLAKASAEKQWFETASGIEDRGRSIGVTMKPGETFQHFKVRVFDAAKLSPDVVRKARIDAGMRP
jgi:uncharacterized protein YdaU (DUF1376 family)